MLLNITEDVKNYRYKIDNIEMNCILAKHDQPFIYYLNLEAVEDSFTYSIGDTLANPLIALTEFYKYYYDDTQIQLVQDLSTGNVNVTGREILMIYSNDLEPPRLLAVRVYYNGHDLLSFSIETSIANQAEFNIYRNNYFSSIVIN